MPVDRTVIAYGAAHFGKSLFWYASELLFAFYLTEVAGLRPLYMGVAVATGLLVSAGIDLAVGRGLAGMMHAPASAGRLQLVGAITSTIFLIAVFLADRLPMGWRFSYAIAASVGFRMAYALYDVPQNTLLGLLEWPGVGRSGMSAIRLTGSGLASILVSFEVGAGFGAPLSHMGSANLLTIMIVFAVVALATSVVLQWALGPLQWSSSESGHGPGRSRRMLLYPLLLTLAASASFSLFTKLEPYFGVHTLGSARWAGLIIGAFSLGAVVAQPCWAYVVARFARKGILACQGILLLLTTLIFMTWARESQTLSLVLAFGLGILNGGVNLLLWRWIADVAAQDPAGRPSFAFAIFSSASKVALAFAGIAIGVTLQSIDYRGQ